MPIQPLIQRAFAGGEIAPALHARADQVRYVTGLRTCRNWMVLRQGGASNRAGTRYIGPCKTTSSNVSLMRYVSATPGESVLIEVGSNYFRFYRGGAIVTVPVVTAWNAATNYVQGDLAESGGINYYAIGSSLNQLPPNPAFWYPLTGDIYEIPHSFITLPYWDQSGNVITLTAHDSAPKELIYESLTRWVLRPVTTSPALPPPTNLVMTTSPGVGTVERRYLVTAAHASTFEESLRSNVLVTTTAAPTSAAPLVLGWTATPGAGEYYVYVDLTGNGIYAYLGTSMSNAFRDPGNIDPDYTITEPLDRALFAGAGDFPARSGRYQQRRLFANTVNDPESVWASRTGFASNFAISTPLQDDDAVTFRLAGKHYHAVQHLIGLKNLVIGTDGGGWVIGNATEPMTPSNVPSAQETYTGWHPLKPVVIGNSIVYLQARGSQFFDLRFAQEVEGLNGNDLTLFASHLFEGFTIESFDYQETPHSIMWAVRSDGTLLGVTYIREQEILAWHRHDTGTADSFEHVCVVPEDAEDVVYVIVRRTVGGVSQRYVEKLERRFIDEGEFDDQAFFVDSGLSYDGAPATVFAGLSHLEGATVAVLADGAYVGTKVVTGGQVTLTTAASKVHVGLPIIADLETLDVDVQGADVRGRRKRVNGVTLLLERSSRQFWVGPDASNLRQYVYPSHETPTDEFTGQAELSTVAQFGKYGRVLVRQVAPLPITLLGIIPDVEVGG